MVFLAPEPARSVNSLELFRFLYGFQDSIRTIKWSANSRFIIAGSEDMTARILSVRRCPKLIVYTLAGHKAPVFGDFLSDSNLDCVTVSTDGEVRVWACDTKLSDMDAQPETADDKALFRLTSK